MAHFVAKKIKIGYNETNNIVIIVDNKKGVYMKKNKLFHRIRAFLLVFLFILPCFSLLACGGEGGGDDGGVGGAFGNIPTYTKPTEKGMLELMPDDGIRLKYLYKFCYRQVHFQ